MKQPSNHQLARPVRSYAPIIAGAAVMRGTVRPRERQETVLRDLALMSRIQRTCRRSRATLDAW